MHTTATSCGGLKSPALAPSQNGKLFVEWPCECNPRAGGTMGDVGQEVRRLREARGWSQPKLAVEAGIAVSGVSQIENGHRNPNSSTLVKLARALDVEVADFFPKVEAPLWSDSTPEERRSRYLRSWRAFV